VAARRNSFKQRIREITRRAKGVSIKTTMEELATYMRGWRSYFGFCETPEVLIALTRWVRLRLRAALWRQWKTPRRRRTALIALEVSGELRNTAGSGRGPWHIARSKALSVGLSNAHFKSLGLLSLKRVSLTSRTAVYGPVRTVVWEGRSREGLPPIPIFGAKRPLVSPGRETVAALRTHPQTMQGASPCSSITVAFYVGF